MITHGNTRGRRGSALMMTYFAAVVLSFMVAYGFRSSLDASNASRGVAITEQADYAAEYAANLAVSQLSNVTMYEPTDPNNLTQQDRDNMGTVVRDWVSSGIYNPNQLKGSDQRRIAGSFGDYDFRVQVRSAKLARELGTMPDSWLSAGDAGDASKDFKDTYEILATARKRGFSAASAPAAAASPRAARAAAPQNNGDAQYTGLDAYTASVYGIVGMKFGDSLNDPDNVKDAVGNIDGQIQGNGFSADGEDHRLDTVFPTMTVSSQTSVLGAQRGQLKKPGESIAGTGGYWSGGQLTLGYMEDARPLQYSDIPGATATRSVYIPARPNPYIPYNRTFSNTKAGSNDLKMISKYQQDKAKFYTSDYYASKKKVSVKSGDRLTDSTMPVDKYFLGGKNVNGGRTVSLQTFDNGKDVYTLAKEGSGVLDPILYEGAAKKSGKTTTYSGVIDPNKAPVAIDKSTLNVLVGSYPELKRFYITFAENPPGGVTSWRTVFVGEWTDIKKSPGTGNTVDNVLFDHSGGTARRRSFSKHYPMRDGKILVREMQWAVTNNKGNVASINNTGSSGKARIWTGRYKWVVPNFTTKNQVTDKATGQKVYPREFTWEEITDQKTKRVSGTDGGKTVSANAATYFAEVDDEGRLVTIKDGPNAGKTIVKEKDSVRIEGYPVTDHLGREVPEVLVENGKVVLNEANEPTFIPAGFTEYCSVDAGDPGKLLPVYFKDTGIDEYGVMKAIQEAGTNSPLPGYTNKKRQFARRNFIEVVEDDGIHYYNNISDLEYLTDVTLEDGTVEKNRRASSITIGIEDLDEAGSDYDYSDMMFTLNVVPATKSEDVILGQNSESSKYIQWWELHPDAGLTGGESQRAISSTENPSVKGIEDPEERYQANFDYLVNGYTAGGRSFVTRDAYGHDVKYNRVVFKEATAEIDAAAYDLAESNIVYYFLARKAGPASDIDGDRYDDIFEFVSRDMDRSPKDYENAKTSLDRKNIGLANLQKQALAQGIDLRDIAERADEDDGDGVLLQLPDDPDFSEEPEYKSLYSVRDEQFTARRMARVAFGGGNIDVATAKTDAAHDREIGDDGQPLPAATGQLMFVAGEVPPKQSATHTPEPQSAQDRIFFQPEGSPAVPAFVNDGILDALVQAQVIESGKRSEIAARSVAQNSLPSLFMSAPGVGRNEVRGVMSLIYDTHMLPGQRSTIEQVLRQDDFRGVLGWHRSGMTKRADDPTGLLLDSYVPVMLTADNLQPYALANPAANDLGEVIAKIRHQFGPDAEEDVVYYASVDTGDRLPTFTFSQEFYRTEQERKSDPEPLASAKYAGRVMDGAGILVVNGNLHVKTTFAYYGLIIVLGDLIVEPEEGWYYRRNAYGDYTDNEGNAIHRDENGEWYRIEVMKNADGVNYEGRVMRDAAGKPFAPALTRQYRGELQVQGKLYVHGDIIVKTAVRQVVDANGKIVEEEIKGRVDAVASRSADEMVGGLGLPDGGRVGRFMLDNNSGVWNTNAANPVGHIWNDEVEKQDG